MTKLLQDTMKFLFQFVMILILPAALIAQDKNCWPVFRGDPELRGTSYAHLPVSPELLWSFKAGDAIKSPPVACGGIIISGSTDGNVNAINLKGELVWRFATGNSIEAPALILNQIVYIGNMDGVLFAIDLNTGKLKWKYSTEGQIMGSVNYYRMGKSIFLLAGSYDNNLHCIDAVKGTLIWKYATDNYINGAAAVSEGLAIFGGCDGFLHTVDIRSGKLKNKVNIATYVASSAATGNGYAYVGDYDGQFTCVSLADNKIIWKFKDDKVQQPFIGSPSLYKDMVIAGNRDKSVYCLNKSTGNVVWAYNTGGRVDASIVIIEEKVLIANMSGDIRIINLQDAKPVWNYELGTPVNGNPAVIDKKIIVAAEDGKIYCFGDK